MTAVRRLREVHGVATLPWGCEMETRRSKAGVGTSRPMREPKPPFPEQNQERPGLESKVTPPPRWRGERDQAAGKLEGQAALVTGGDSGIGRSVAYHFAREGAAVAITCLPQERADAQQEQRVGTATEGVSIGQRRPRG